ncbi:beta-N-acetylhexosaminidase [Mucilaginibacter sp.]|uniref:beta-N-acetylhexosaminidase n=1 Tax=Mucilaginibacter sp. TaxID=1882438 RepID=UPI003AFFCC78
MKKTLLLFGCCLLFLQVVFAQTETKNFKVKGYHIDLRLQVIKMPALKNFVQKLKNNGINTLIMEWEATYPFHKYPLIANRYAYTQDEISSFMKFCDSLHIDVIPLQQSFGHVEYILRNFRFANLREDQRDFSQVCPSEEAGDKALFTDLFSELAKTHKSKYFHIGGDETYLLGHCEKCQKKVAEEGLSKLYIDHIRMLCDIVIKLGKIPVLWADIALKHPEDIKLLPKETVFIDWNYGWDLNQFGNLDNLLKNGYEVWGAPAIRSGPDNYFFSDWQLHFNNLHNFIPAARKLGYTGMVLTSWSTTGLFNPIFNSGFDIIEDYPRGHRYPFTGYNMLLEAFFESVNKPVPLNIAAFIDKYARQTFDFNPAQAALMWKAIGACPYEVRQGKVMTANPPTIKQMLDSTIWAAKTLQQLKPLKGAEEFAHLQLMTDIRVQYLQCYEIESMLNADTFNNAQYPAIATKLDSVLAKSPELDKRFIALNKNTFYLAELQAENKIRNEHIQVLHDRVAKIRSSPNNINASK